MKNDAASPPQKKKKKWWESVNIYFIARRVLYSCGLELPKCGYVLPYNCWLFKDSPKNVYLGQGPQTLVCWERWKIFSESQIYPIESFSNSLIWLSFQRLKSRLWVWIEAKLEENTYINTHSGICNRTLLHTWSKRKLFTRTYNLHKEYF